MQTIIVLPGHCPDGGGKNNTEEDATTTAHVDIPSGGSHVEDSWTTVKGKRRHSSVTKDRETREEPQMEDEQVDGDGLSGEKIIDTILAKETVSKMEKTGKF